MEVTSALIVEEIKKHEDGKVDLLGLFEDIYVREVPVAVDNFSLFLDLELCNQDKGKKHVIEIRLVDADGRLVVRPATKISFDIPFEESRARSTAQLDLDFPNLIFKSFGVHYLEVIIDGEAARRVYLSVQQRSDT